MKAIKKVRKIKNNTIKGQYILEIFLKKDKDIVIGALGKINFKKGYYAYVGSARSSLNSRVKRHISKKKKTIRWHIDHLLKNKDAKIIKVILFESKTQLECKISKEVKKISDDEIKYFGCSDCLCSSHLYYFYQVPSFHPERYFFCKGVNLSILTPSDSS